MGRIRAIHIRNYRSCCDWVDIDFPKRGPLVLVGPNNSGKSNIVRAIDLVLGEGWPGVHQPDDHEYYGRSRDATPMEVVIDDENVSTTSGSSTFDVAQFHWRCPPDNPEDHRPVEFNMISPDGIPRWANNDARNQCYCMVISA